MFAVWTSKLISPSVHSRDDDDDATVNAAANPRGIPRAPFVDQVEDYVSSRAEVEGTLRSFQEMISLVLRTDNFVRRVDEEVPIMEG